MRLRPIWQADGGYGAPQASSDFLILAIVGRLAFTKRLISLSDVPQLKESLYVPLRRLVAYETLKEVEQEVEAQAH